MAHCRFSAEQFLSGMNETSRPGPEECSNSHWPRASICSTFHICSAAVCKEQGGRCCCCTPAECRHSVQEHCSCVLPGALFFSVWWFGLQLRTSDSGLVGWQLNCHSGYVYAVSMGQNLLCPEQLPQQQQPHPACANELSCIPAQV